VRVAALYIILALVFVPAFANAGETAETATAGSGNARFMKEYAEWMVSLVDDEEGLRKAVRKAYIENCTGPDGELTTVDPRDLDEEAMLVYASEWAGFDKFQKGPKPKKPDLAESERKDSGEALLSLGYYFAMVYMDEGYRMGVYAADPEAEEDIRRELVDLRRRAIETVTPYLNAELSKSDMQKPGFYELSGIEPRK